MVGQLLLFGIRGFRVGREVEEVVEKAFEELAQMASQPKPEDPKVAIERTRAMIDERLGQMDLQGKVMDQQGKQMDLQARREGHAMDMRERMADAAVAAAQPAPQPGPAA